MSNDQQQYLDAQEGSQMRSSAQSMGLQVAAEHKERTVHNEDFLNELRKPDLDDSLGDSHLEEEFADWFSGAHAVTNRGDDWDVAADLIMQNKRERALTERRPGRLLRSRPFMLAAMQGAPTPQIDAYDRGDIPGSRQYWESKLIDKPKAKRAATSKEMSRIYGAAEVASDLMTLSRNAAGLESVSTVKTETNVRRQEEDETTKERVGRWME